MHRPVLFSTTRRRPSSTLFPYTTLFRSPLLNLRCGRRETVTDPLRPPHRPPHALCRNLRRSFAHAEVCVEEDRKSTRLNSSHRCISYAVFCLKKKRKRLRMSGSPCAAEL